MTTTCKNKRIYYTKQAACRAIKADMLHFQERMYFYECEHCGFYHLSRRKRKRRRFRIRTAGITFFN